MDLKPPVSSSIFPKVTQKVQGLDLREQNRLKMLQTVHLLDLREHLRGENLILWQTGKKKVRDERDRGKEGRGEGRGEGREDGGNGKG